MFIVLLQFTNRPGNQNTQGRGLFGPINQPDIKQVWQETIVIIENLYGGCTMSLALR